MRIVVTGGTGLIGRHLVAALRQDPRREVVVLTRTERPSEGNLRYRTWDPKQPGDWQREVDGAWAVVNLAGEGLLGGGWTPERMQELKASRFRATELLVEAMTFARERPQLFVSASSVGFYGPREELLDEGSRAGTDFLAATCAGWEARAMKAEKLGVRTATPRLGLVLSAQGGAMETLLAQFKALRGGPAADAEEWLPWVHRLDAVRAVLYPFLRESLSGPYNVAAGEPVRLAEFNRALGQALGRPAWLPALSSALRLGGATGKSGLLTGQRVASRRLAAEGFELKFPALPDALADLLRKPEAPKARAARSLEPRAT